MPCLQRHSATAYIYPSFPQCRLCSVSLRNVCSSSWYGSGRVWLRRTYSFCSPGSLTDVSLPGWQPVPSALGWPSAMAACDHPGVVLLGGCCISYVNIISLYFFFYIYIYILIRSNFVVSGAVGSYVRVMMQEVPLTWLWSGKGMMDAHTPRIMEGWISQWVYVEQ